MQPRIEADAAALGNVERDFVGHAALADFVDGDLFGVGLGGRLQGIAAVDEQASLFRADDGDAGRAGEASDIGEAGLPGRHRFAAMGIGTRDKERIEPGLDHFATQGRKAGGDVFRIGFFLKALKNGGGEGLGGHIVRPGAGMGGCWGNLNHGTGERQCERAINEAVTGFAWRAWLP